MKKEKREEKGDGAIGALSIVARQVKQEKGAISSFAVQAKGREKGEGEKEGRLPHGTRHTHS